MVTSVVIPWCKTKPTASQRGVDNPRMVALSSTSSAGFYYLESKRVPTPTDIRRFSEKAVVIRRGRKGMNVRNNQIDMQRIQGSSLRVVLLELQNPTTFDNMNWISSGKEFERAAKGYRSSVVSVADCNKIIKMINEMPGDMEDGDNGR